MHTYIHVYRHARLASLVDGGPIGGANNQGNYVFKLPACAHDKVNGEPVYGVDAEDPCRSGWCRYLNHAPSGSDACNVESRVDAAGAIWFVVSHPAGIEPGVELCFDYGPNCTLADYIEPP